MTPVLEMTGVDAGYERLRVVRDFTLTVRPGELVALLGPNGAGKSTVLRTAAGLLPRLAGEVRVMGRALPTTRPFEAARRGLSLVPEHRALFTALTVRENLRLGGRNRRTQDVCIEAIECFPDLERLLDRRAGLLSGGEQQMLAVARALVSRPALLVVDEMSFGLAPKVVRRLIAMLRTVADDTGVAVLFVEQYVHLALGVADRAVVMQQGRIVTDGAAADVRARASELTASYLGGAVSMADTERSATVQERLSTSASER